MYTEDFNPNSKKYIHYKTKIRKEHLATYLVSLCKLYYEKKCARGVLNEIDIVVDDKQLNSLDDTWLHECPHCGTRYDDQVGEPDLGIPAGTFFPDLPETYQCPLCETGKSEFQLVNQSS